MVSKLNSNKIKLGEQNSYRELKVWKKSMKLVSMVYELCEFFPESERFGLVSQMKRASVSIPSNIAEGNGRESPRSMIQFLKIARGSLYELETQLLLAIDLKCIKKCDNELSLIIEISKMINALRRSKMSKI